MSDNDLLSEIDAKLSIIMKMMYMLTKSATLNLKKELVTTEKQEKLYTYLDGKKNMEDLSKITGVSVKRMESLLPQWEKAGLILSLGKGRGKRYLSLDNLEV